MICDALFDILFYKLILEKIYSILAYFGVLTAWVGGITILLFSPLMIYLEMYYLMIIYFCIIGYQYIVGYCVEIKFLKRFTSKYYRKYFKDSKRLVKIIKLYLFEINDNKITCTNLYKFK